MACSTTRSGTTIRTTTTSGVDDTPPRRRIFPHFTGNAQPMGPPHILSNDMHTRAIDAFDGVLSFLKSGTPPLDLENLSESIEILRDSLNKVDLPELRNRFNYSDIEWDKAIHQLLQSDQDETLHNMLNSRLEFERIKHMCLGQKPAQTVLLMNEILGSDTLRVLTDPVAQHVIGKELFHLAADTAKKATVPEVEIPIVGLLTNYFQLQLGLKKQTRHEILSAHDQAEQDEREQELTRLFVVGGVSNGIGDIGKLSTRLPHHPAFLILKQFKSALVGIGLLSEAAAIYKSTRYDIPQNHNTYKAAQAALTYIQDHADKMPDTPLNRTILTGLNNCFDRQITFHRTDGIGNGLVLTGKAFQTASTLKLLSALSVQGGLSAAAPVLSALMITALLFTLTGMGLRLSANINTAYTRHKTRKIRTGLVSEPTPDNLQKPVQTLEKHLRDYRFLLEEDPVFLGIFLKAVMLNEDKTETQPWGEFLQGLMTAYRGPDNTITRDQLMQNFGNHLLTGSLIA